MKISKSVSAGNSAVVGPADYLEYLAQDAETKVIAMYLEGVQEGRRLFDVLRRTTPLKPVVVWKGGLSEGGRRAMFSHTGGLATSAAVWQALVAQTGVIATDSLDETLDVVKALLFTKPATGRRMGLVALTGGQSVVITDAFEREGLEVPLLSERSYAELAGFFNIVGGSYRNPLDAGGTLGFGASPENLQRMLRDAGGGREYRRGGGRGVAADDGAASAGGDAVGATGCRRCWAGIEERIAPSRCWWSCSRATWRRFVAQERQKYVERGIPTFAGFDAGGAGVRAGVTAYRRFVARSGIATGGQRDERRRAGINTRVEQWEGFHEGSRFLRPEPAARHRRGRHRAAAEGRSPRQDRRFRPVPHRPPFHGRLLPLAGAGRARPRSRGRRRAGRRGRDQRPARRPRRPLLDAVLRRLPLLRGRQALSLCCGRRLASDEGRHEPPDLRKRTDSPLFHFLGVSTFAEYSGRVRAWRW